MTTTIITLDYDAAHEYVESKTNDRRKKVFWEGWNIVSFRPNPRAMFTKDGRYIDGKWGFASVTEPSDDGLWRVSEYTRPSRN